MPVKSQPLKGLLKEHLNSTKVLEQPVQVLLQIYEKLPKVPSGDLGGLVILKSQ